MEGSQQIQGTEVVAGRYALKREIARGGMAVVFEAQHLVTGARAALKVLLPSLRGDVATRERMTREARAVGALRHPNIVTVFDAGVCPEHGPFVALEMLGGRPLDGILVARRTLPVDQALALVEQLCDALENVHRHGIVHRDVKASNVIVCSGLSGDLVKLIDFGVARLPECDVSAEGSRTLSGHVLGTAEYMAPEQVLGARDAGPQADVYSLGALLYECLSGEAPFTGAISSILSKLLAGNRPPPLGARCNVAPALEAVVHRALELNPAARFRSAREFGQACVAAFGTRLPALDLLAGLSSTSRSTAITVHATENTSSSQASRRQFVRAPYVTPVRLLSGKGSFDGRTEDISEGGVLVITRTTCVRNEKVNIRMSLPISGRLVVAEGVTRWLAVRKNQCAVGVEFQRLPSEGVAEIRSYVQLMQRDPGYSDAHRAVLREDLARVTR